MLTTKVIVMLSDKRKNHLQGILTNLGLPTDTELELISQALTHPSYLYEGISNIEHNQRLEFLGDAVIGLVVAQYLFQTYPKKSEGELTKMRAAVVCEASLAEAAQTLNLGAYLQMGRGEGNMGGATRVSNLADSFEALMGAIYLTFGLEPVAQIILKILNNKIAKAARGRFGDYKTQLQEYVQKKPEQILSYQIISEDGPDHDKTFVAGVYLNQKQIAIGNGRTKKEAEQQAARQALHILGGK